MTANCVPSQDVEPSRGFSIKTIGRDSSMANLNTQASLDAGRVTAESTGLAARFDCLHIRFRLSIIHSRWFILGWLSQPQLEASLA
jgi:hypothetical protein